MSLNINTTNGINKRVPITQSQGQYYQTQGVLAVAPQYYTSWDYQPGPYYSQQLPTPNAAPQLYYLTPAIPGDICATSNTPNYMVEGLNVNSYQQNVVPVYQYPTYQPQTYYPHPATQGGMMVQEGGTRRSYNRISVNQSKEKVDSRKFCEEKGKTETVFRPEKMLKAEEDSSVVARADQLQKSPFQESLHANFQAQDVCVKTENKKLDIFPLMHQQQKEQKSFQSDFAITKFNKPEEQKSATENDFLSKEGVAKEKIRRKRGAQKDRPSNNAPPQTFTVVGPIPYMDNAPLRKDISLQYSIIYRDTIMLFHENDKHPSDILINQLQNSFFYKVYIKTLQPLLYEEWRDKRTFSLYLKGQRYETQELVETQITQREDLMRVLDTAFGALYDTYQIYVKRWCILQDLLLSRGKKEQFERTMRTIVDGAIELSADGKTLVEHPSIEEEAALGVRVLNVKRSILKERAIALLCLEKVQKGLGCVSIQEIWLDAFGVPFPKQQHLKQIQRKRRTCMRPYKKREFSPVSAAVQAALVEEQRSFKSNLQRLREENGDHYQALYESEQLFYGKNTVEMDAFQKEQVNPLDCGKVSPQIEEVLSENVQEIQIERVMRKDETQPINVLHKPISKHAFRRVRARRRTQQAASAENSDDSIDEDNLKNEQSNAGSAVKQEESDPPNHTILEGRLPFEQQQNSCSRLD